MIDATQIRAHRSASGQKEGTQAGDCHSRGKRNKKIRAIADTRGHPLSALLTGVRRTIVRLIRCSKGQKTPRRQGIRQRSATAMAGGSRYQTRQTQQIKPQAALQLRQKLSPEALLDRESIFPPQRLPTNCRTLRRARKKTSLHPPASWPLSYVEFYEPGL
jgi:hypothetical protein